MKDQILNRFVGTMSDRDEYQKQEIYKELAYSGILLYWLCIFLMFICLLVDTYHHTLSVGTIGLLVIVMGYSVVFLQRIRKKQLDITEFTSEEEYKAAVGKLLKNSIKGGLLWGIQMFILMQYILPYIADGEIKPSWYTFLIFVVFGSTFFGGAIYLLAKSKMKKII